MLEVVPPSQKAAFNSVRFKTELAAGIGIVAVVALAAEVVRIHHHMAVELVVVAAEGLERDRKGSFVAVEDVPEDKIAAVAPVGHKLRRRLGQGQVVRSQGDLGKKRSRRK